MFRDLCARCLIESDSSPFCSARSSVQVLDLVRVLHGDVVGKISAWTPPPCSLRFSRPGLDFPIFDERSLWVSAFSETGVQDCVVAITLSFARRASSSRHDDPGTVQGVPSTGQRAGKCARQPFDATPFRKVVERVFPAACDARLSLHTTADTILLKTWYRRFFIWSEGSDFWTRERPPGCLAKTGQASL